MNTKSSILLLAFLTIIGFACQKAPEKNNGLLQPSQLKGEWQVKWETSPGKNMPVDTAMSYTMNGTMTFSDSKLTIVAQGYDGCIFGADTLTHTLNWSLSGDTLSAINEGDKYGIPYMVREASQNSIKLKLVDDVFLELTK